MIKTNPLTDQFHCHLTSKKMFVKEKMINQEHILQYPISTPAAPIIFVCSIC